MAEREMLMSLKKDEVSDLVGTLNHSRIGRRLNYDGRFIKIIKREESNRNFYR